MASFSRRLRALAPYAFLACGLSCATPSSLAPGAAIRPSAELGVGFLTIRPALHTDLVIFVSDDGMQQVLLPNSSKITTTLHAFEAPPGRYCLESLRTAEVALFFGRVSRRIPCFEVRAQEQRYFGRIELDQAWKFRISRHDDEDLRRLSEQHPTAKAQLASFVMVPSN